MAIKQFISSQQLQTHTNRENRVDQSPQASIPQLWAFHRPPAHAKTQPRQSPPAVFSFQKRSSAIAMETGKAPRVARETRVKICFHDSMQKSRSPRESAFPAVLPALGTPLESAQWPPSVSGPCPRPRPSPSCPSGRPASASLSSAPATRSTAPGRPNKEVKTFPGHKKLCRFPQSSFKAKGLQSCRASQRPRLLL